MQHKQTESAFKYAVNIVSDIEITAVIETSETAEAIQTVERLRDFILNLPSWFDAMHISLILSLDSSYTAYSLFDEFADTLAIRRSGLTFKSSVFR